MGGVVSVGIGGEEFGKVSKGRWWMLRMGMGRMEGKEGLEGSVMEGDIGEGRDVDEIMDIGMGGVKGNKRMDGRVW